MRRGIGYGGEPSTVNISSRRRRIIAVKAIVTYLERIRDAERRSMASAEPHRRCESELISSAIDDAIFILEILY